MAKFVMDPNDYHKPYAPETHGDLEEYLREHDGYMADNLFHGPEYFHRLKDKEYLIPGETMLRVDRSPIPDVSYFVNQDYLLESFGVGKINMSKIGAEKGVYTPEEALEGMNWSINPLNLPCRESQGSGQ